MVATKPKPKPKTRAKAKPRESVRLSRDDWLDAAFSAVVEGGFDAVRVLTLADRLGVTRGSFYWHFADHAELVQALLARWRERELVGNKALREQANPDPLLDLELLLDAALAQPGRELENMRFELALRGLGRRNPKVAAMLVEVDEARLGLFEHKFRRLTGDKAAASDLAVLFYLAVVGSHQALSRPVSPPRMREYLKGIIAKHLIRPHRPVNPTPSQ